MTAPQRYTAETLLTFQGITQPIYEWALDYGIPPQTILIRLKSGSTIERAITKPILVRTADAQLDWMDSSTYKHKLNAASAPRYLPSDTVEHDGLSMTVAQWAAHVGVKVQTLRLRLRAGLPLADALGPRQSGSRKGYLYTHDGLTMTLLEWSKHLGLSKAALYGRIRFGKPLSEALSSGDKRGNTFNLWRSGRQAKLYSHNGLSLSLTQWAERLGVARKVLDGRLQRGWTIEQTLTAGNHKGKGRPRGGWSAT